MVHKDFVPDGSIGIRKDARYVIKSVIWHLATFNLLLIQNDIDIRSRDLTNQNLIPNMSWSYVFILSPNLKVFW